VQTGSEALLGVTGEVVSALDPEGTVRVRGEVWTARTEGDHIESDSPVRVAHVDGVVLVVEPEAPAEDETA
jgi:membrane-bound serine protease (ClpP class)